MLFWAEGDKQRNTVRISNADPEVLVFFAGFLREHFGVRDEHASSGPSTARSRSTAASSGAAGLD